MLLSMPRPLPLLSCLALAASLRAAPQDASQPAAKPPAFEVVSVKLNKDCPGAGARPVLSPGRVQVPCMNARGMIRLAFGAFTGADLCARVTNVANGPSRIDSDFFQVLATTPAPATAAQILGPMLRGLLEDRFKLKVHTEPRENSVYLLTVAEGKSNLQPTKEGDCVPMDIFSGIVGYRPPSGANTCGQGKGTMKEGLMAFDATGVTMDEFAGRLLANYADRPVVNKTGLTGRFNLHLDFVPPRPQGTVLLNGQPVTLPPAPDDAGPSIYTALQKQLGLKLSPGRAPIDVLVIDNIEKPSEN